MAGRDAAAALVDCSAVLGKTWEFWGVSLLSLAQMLARPFGVSVSMQPGLAAPTLTQKLCDRPGRHRA